MDSLRTLLKLLKLYDFKTALNLLFRFKIKNYNNISIPSIKSTINLRNNTSDKIVFDQIFLNKEYNIEKWISNPKIIFDLGANIGLFSVLMANSHPEATIISLEPDSDNFHLAKQNLAQYENVNLLKKGIWSKSTFLKVYDKFKMGKFALVVEEVEFDTGLESVSINDLVAEYNIERIDILKIDIETSEKEIFRVNYSHWLLKTKMLIIELHDFMEPGCAKIFFDAINKVYSSYEMHITGENIVIINQTSL